MFPRQSYSWLIENAGVVVDVALWNQDPLICWCTSGSSRKKLVAFVDGKRKVSLCEVSFGRETPYGTARIDTVSRRDHVPFALHRYWEYTKWLINLIADERLSGRKEFIIFHGSRRSGVCYRRMGSQIRSLSYQGRAIKEGLIINIDTFDAPLLENLFREEPFGRYWRKRISWCADTVNRIVTNWRAGRRAGINGLENLFRHPYNSCFLRGGILSELVSMISKNRQSAFLSFLDERRLIDFDLHQSVSYTLSRSKNSSTDRPPQSALSVVYRGRRRSGSYRFEVFARDG